MEKINSKTFRKSTLTKNQQSFIKGGYKTGGNTSSTSSTYIFFSDTTTKTDYSNDTTEGRKGINAIDL